MNLVTAVVLGVIEGITEFLPVSSTAHLILAARYLNIVQTDFIKLFEVVIQSGAILAVIVLYFQYAVKHKDLWSKLLISFLPTAVIGFVLQRIIVDIFFESYFLISFSLFFIAIVFILIESMIKNKKLTLTRSMHSLTTQEAFVVGIGQSLAVIPGVSRAGIVIATLMLQKVKRDEAAVYSFLLAVPTILAASVFSLYKERDVLAGAGDDMTLIALGFITSLVVAYISVKWLLEFLKTNTLVPFAYYRILLAIIVLLTLIAP